MKKLFTILLLFMYLGASATQYFVSAGGSNSNAGTSSGAPWQTISKLNGFAFNPGDIISFNRGDVFVGTIIISRNGSAGNPIIYNSYGSGANPVITGFVTVSAWTNLGGNIWESTSAVSTLSDLNCVVINGVNTQMGRTPNTGWFTVGSKTNQPSPSITSGSLNASVTNWSGADVVMKNFAFAASRDSITSASGSTINFIATTLDNPAVGYGFFIEDDSRTLDLQNEWYFTQGKKLRIFSASTPSNVQVATLDTLVYMTQKHDLTFDGIDFTGSNKRAFFIGSSSNITIQNCGFRNHGLYAVWGGNNFGLNSNNFNFNNNAVRDINSQAIVLQTEYVNPYIGHNTFRNCGTPYGMFKPVGNRSNGAYDPILCSGTNGLHVEYNFIDSTGYAGIRFSGQNTTINNNEVAHALMRLQDGGGIYTWTGPNGTPTNFSRIYNNLCHDGVGDNTGTLNTGAEQVQGIYLDENVQNTQVYNNSCWNNVYGGLFSNSNKKCNFHDNTFYNNGVNAARFESTFRTNGDQEINDTVKNNIFFSRVATQLTSQVVSSQTDVPVFFNICDSNYYARPISDNLTIRTQVAGITTDRNLAQWVTYSGFDVHSKKSPVTITNVNQLDFEYNATTSAVAKSLPPGTWIDVRGVAYVGTITLQPYTSAVLINTGVVNVAPTANAGTNKNITLPTNSVTQVGSGSDVDGTISAYLWTYVSGPGGATIVSATSATTDFTNLVAGTHVFQLMVTDNQGATGTDQTTITVNPTPPVNIAPIANAGGNKTITLPISTVTQVGSGTDADGTVVSYAWTKISGPAAGTIVSPGSATTVINNLTIAGTYVYQILVTDNLGATGAATATIIVNPALNINPTANASSDQVLTWPTNTSNLTGLGTDPDGTIASYQWTKISGPALFSITNPNSQNTTVTGLDIGVYQFQLKVTDNSGGTNTDVMQVTVNKGAATISLSGLSVVFNNLPQSPIVTTNPAGLTYSLTLSGTTGGKINAGSYPAVAGITDPHWTFTPASATFTITQATAVINASSATVNFDNLPHSITATTTPNVGVISATYTGISGTVYPTSATPPTAIGTYRVDFILTNSNYQATPINVTLTIVSNPAIIFISDTDKVYNGSPQSVTVTCAYSYTLTGAPQTNAGNYVSTATINDGIHTGSFTATLRIAKADGVNSWPPISPVPFGTMFSTVQLNASSTVSGTWLYSVSLGDIPAIGTTGLTATFFPTDPANYNGAVLTNSISVYGVNPFLDFFFGNDIFFLKLP